LFVFEEQEGSGEMAEGGGKGGGGDNQGGLGILGHGLETGGGVAGVEREVAGARFEDGQEGEDEIGGAVEADGDGKGRRGEGEAVVGEVVGPGSELGVGEVAGGGDEGDGVGCGGGLGLEEAVDGGVARVFDRAALPIGGRHRTENILNLSHLWTLGTHSDVPYNAGESKFPARGLSADLTRNPFFGFKRSGQKGKVQV
jgi:hypothetical protein